MPKGVRWRKGEREEKEWNYSQISFLLLREIERVGEERDGRYVLLTRCKLHPLLLLLLSHKEYLTIQTSFQNSLVLPKIKSLPLHQLKTLSHSPQKVRWLQLTFFRMSN